MGYFLQVTIYHGIGTLNMSVRRGESDRVGGNSHRRMGISTLERLEDRVQVAAHVQLSTWRFSSPLVVPSNQSVPADA